MQNLYATAHAWESDNVTDSAREELKAFVTELVGYPCKVACKVNGDVADIYVFSVEKNRMADWFELQPSGAIGVIFDLYEDEERSEHMNNVCESTNDKNDVEFMESDSDESSSYSSDSQSE